MPIRMVNPVGGKRKRKKTAAKRNPAKKRRVAKKRGRGAARKAAAPKRKRNPARKTARKRRTPTMASPRRRSRRKNPWKEKKKWVTVRRRVAPGHRAAALKGARKKSRKKNPAGGGLADLLKQAAAPVLALYGSRLLSGRVADKIPMLPPKARGPVVAAALAGLGFLATSKVKALSKHQTGIMIGLGINLADKIVGALAPENLKSMIGVGASEDMYRQALAEYVAINSGNQLPARPGAMSEYVAVDGAPPIDDDITLSGMSDYIEVDGFEQDLGMEEALGVEQDLGFEQDLGAFGDSRYGGLSLNAMAAPIPKEGFVGKVPAVSFTGPVKKFGAGFDSSPMLYTGIFSGGSYAGR